MEIHEIVGFRTGIDRGGVDFLDPPDAFQELNNGFVYRQELRSRKGFTRFGNRLGDNLRVMGIFEDVQPDSTIETLVCTKDHLYKYDSGTDGFIVIPTAGILGAGHTFGITNNFDYVSGTTYLTKTGSRRFVFTSRGMSKIYFYDGTDVKDFTNSTLPTPATSDNPDYQAPAAGPLTKATKVMWFGERLNFFVPVIDGVTLNQAVLYSAIRNSAGNGDKFNSPGAGTLEADTYELMKGTAFLGDLIVMKFQRSAYILRKTQDAFNPYRIEKIPSVLGTDATFSPLQWNYEIKSVGKTGFITTDGRKSLRFDTKIPNFTSNDIDADNFELIYGGFDRNNGQFLFAYRDTFSSLSDVTQDKVLVYNYEEDTWAVYDQRFSCFGQTIDGKAIPMGDIDGTGNQPSSWSRMDTTEEIMNKLGSDPERQKTLAGDNDGFVYDINRDFDDYFVNISGITKASSAILTITASAFKIGDKVNFENVGGMTEMNNLSKTPTVTAATATSITVNVDSTNFTTYTVGGSVSKLIEFKAKFAPFNPFRKEGRKVSVSNIEVLLDNDSGPVSLSIYANEEGEPFKTTLLSPISTTSRSPKEWINVVVNEEANFLTFELTSLSAQFQVVVSGMRIHAERGSMNNG